MIEKGPGNRRRLCLSSGLDRNLSLIRLDGRHIGGRQTLVDLRNILDLNSTTIDHTEIRKPTPSAQQLVPILLVFDGIRRLFNLSIFKLASQKKRL